MILLPAAVFVCAIASLTLRREHFEGRGYLVGGFAAICLLPFLHIIPLPPFVWQNLPGREIQVEIDAILNTAEIWRPLTLTPDNALHSLASLLVPLAVLLLGVQFSRGDLFRLLPVLITLGALSGLFGVLQLAGNQNGPLYLYRITNEGAAVGLFANRNHAASLLACLFPMLAAFASTASATHEKQRARTVLAIALAIILLPLILATGSRSGLILAVIGICAATLLYKKPVIAGIERRRSARFAFKPIPFLGSLAVVCLVLLSIFFSRANAVDRLFKESDFEAGRLEFWTASLQMAWKYFPFGSGAGSFVEAYQIDEPGPLLYASYLNHAHNDWLETFVTFGFPGIILILGIAACFIISAFKLYRQSSGSRQSITMAKSASVGLVILALASFTDYPVRTPIMMSVAMIFALWFNEWRRNVFLEQPEKAERSSV